MQDLALAEAYYKKGEYRRAIKVCGDALRLNSNIDWPKTLLEKIVEDLSKSISTNPKEYCIWEDRATAKYSLGRYEKAIQDSSEAIGLNPNSDFAWMRRGAAKRMLRRYEEAIQDFDEAIRLNSQNDDAWAQRGDAKQMLRRYEKAIQDLSEAVRLNPKDDWAFEQRGQAKQLLGRYEESIQDFDIAIRLNPKSDFAWAHRGGAKYSLGAHERAIQDFDIAIRLNPKSDFAWAYRGDAKRKLGRNEEAIQDLNEALKLNPKLENAWACRGGAKRSLYRCEEAIQDFDEALRLNPKYDDVWACRGDVKRMLARYEEAIQDFNEALRLNPKNDFAKKQRAEAKKQFGKTKEELEKNRAAVDPKVEPQKSHIPQERPVPSAPILTGYSFPRPSAPELTGCSVTKPRVSAISGYSPGSCLLQDEPPVGQSRGLEVDVLAISRKNLIISDRVIGIGFFGEVRYGQWAKNDGRVIDVAVKQLKLDVLPENSRENFKKEIAIHSNLNCTYVVKLWGVTLPDDEFSYSMIMEVMDRGNLYNMLHEIPREVLGWDVRVQIAVDVAMGLIYLHGQNPMVVHSDIKSLNILLSSDGYAKITDFGLATLKQQLMSRYYVHDNSQQNNVRGSLLWMAPEQFRMNVRRGPECDMYSFGILLWEGAVHDVPYSCANGDPARIKQYKQDNEKEAFDERAAGIPSEYQYVSEQCWDADPKKRLTAKQALEKLQESEIYRKNKGVRLLFPAKKVATEEKTVVSIYTNGFVK